MESHVSSAAAFVEGGIQDACDDSCSICLESFCENDPSTVTCCKHEFHLQCILEWCQRSSQCPMCWQALGLKDPISQELLEAVEKERSIRSNRSRNASIFHHPTLGDLELQHVLPVGSNDSELEERIIQHLAAAAAMGRAHHHIARREGQRGRASAHGNQQFLVFSTNPNTSNTSSMSTHGGDENLPEAAIEESMQSEIGDAASNRLIFSNSRYILRSKLLDSLEGSFAGQSSLNSQDRAGPSDFQSLSESFKSRLSAVSMRYRDSISRNTRGWKERFFSRNASMSDIGSEVRREVNAGIATVSRMMERLDTRDNQGGAASGSAPLSTQNHAVRETSNESLTERPADTLPNNSNISNPCPASSGPN